MVIIFDNLMITVTTKQNWRWNRIQIDNKKKTISLNYNMEKFGIEIELEKKIEIHRNVRKIHLCA